MQRVHFLVLSPFPMGAVCTYTVCSCARESAASTTYPSKDTRHDTQPSHSKLTLHHLVLAFKPVFTAKHRGDNTHFDGL